MTVKGQGAGVWGEYPELADQCMKLWKDGVSASVIAYRLNASIPGGGGLSRNAVIGKIYRMGGPSRDRTHHASQRHLTRIRKQREAKSHRPLPKRQSTFGAYLAGLKADKLPPPEPPFIPEAERKSLLDLEAHDCRFPVTADKPFMFCARKKLPGLPYCADHARIAYQAPPPRKSLSEHKPMLHPFSSALASKEMEPA